MLFTNDSLAGRIFTVFGTLLLFVVILYLAYLTTKMIGKRYSLGNTGNKNLKILDNMGIGQDKSLAIVEAGGKTVLIGISREHIEYICDVDKTQLVKDDKSQNPASAFEFAEILKKTAAQKLNDIKGKKENKADAASVFAEENTEEKYAEENREENEEIS